MKAKKSFSLFGVLIIMISTVVFIAACTQATGNTGNTGNNNSAGKVVQVGATSEADPALKGTEWNSPDKYLSFSEKGNTVQIYRYGMAIYKKEGKKISFDLSAQISIYKTMTKDNYIKLMKAFEKEQIAELKKRKEKAESDEEKAQLEKDIKEAEKVLQQLDNPDEEMQAIIKEDIEFLKKRGAALEPYKTFEGTLTGDKLEIEKFPVYDETTNKVTVSKIKFIKK